VSAGARSVIRWAGDLRATRITEQRQRVVGAPPLEDVTRSLSASYSQGRSGAGRFEPDQRIHGLVGADAAESHHRSPAQPRVRDQANQRRDYLREDGPRQAQQRPQLAACRPGQDLLEVLHRSDRLTDFDPAFEHRTEREEGLRGVLVDVPDLPFPEPVERHQTRQPRPVILLTMRNSR
jgi:hypothetical protein